MNFSSQATEIPSSFLADGDTKTIICYYKNETGQLQLIRIPDIHNRYFERTLFPGERLIFESLLGACLEVHTYEYASAMLADRIPCQSLATMDS